ncbi:o-succinylbenzoate synthase [Planococcus shenhongbingii]|uniref:o-succinylbenzoate synthase n=1 Tax=Planococcus shenhongbingii TaxID=3058398 RepID=UPI00263831ED|nr:o-succinylbenzoate synthase [Planococcus sp. N016]WKA58266.1 o-succinylbenzoate synthase [Planococcus sp. N016]
MEINKIVLRRMKLDLLSPFQTSFGVQTDREFMIVELHGESNIGYGECVASAKPLYSEETVGTVELMLKDILIPALLNEKAIKHPDELSEIFKPFRRNNMAKSALEGAYWDLYAKENNVPLHVALGGTKSETEVGVSIGIQDSTEELLKVVEGFLEEGYKRIKLKIKPGNDMVILKAVREKFPDIKMMADANSAYTLEDVELFKEMSEFNLMMIEQPLAHDDIIDHSKLQPEIQTPICLDESIHSLEDAKKAIGLGSCKIINIKIGRVGGLSEAKRIHDYCQSQDIPVWCGGMLESGIGRAHNIAISSLPNFTLPGDTAASSRYWHEDIITPEVVVEQGVISLPTAPGIGYDPNMELMEKYTTSIEEIIPQKMTS